MDRSIVRSVMSEAHDCAMVMLENARYIQGELAGLPLDEELRATTEEVCSALVGTKHDVVSELSELDELPASQASLIRARVDRILEWFWADIARMHELVKALRSVAEADARYRLAQVLVTESATNILAAFNRTRAAADALRAETREDRGG